MDYSIPVSLELTAIAGRIFGMNPAAGVFLGRCATEPVRSRVPVELRCRCVTRGDEGIVSSGTGVDHASQQG